MYYDYLSIVNIDTTVQHVPVLTDRPLGYTPSFGELTNHLVTAQLI